MAVVVLCGLVTSACLSLFVLPALYARFGPTPRSVDYEGALVRQWTGLEPVLENGPALEPADGDGAPAPAGPELEGQR
jgi:hypothetical protein